METKIGGDIDRLTTVFYGPALLGGYMFDINRPKIVFYGPVVFRRYMFKASFIFLS